MPSRNVPIRRHMVESPVTIGAKETLAAAHALMRRHRIRHLPVLSGETLTGVVSLRDLHLVETLKDVDPQKVTVDEAMTPSPYTVRPSTPLAEVARRMAERKLGSAIVVEKGKVVGMFTTVDAIRLLAELVSPKPRARNKRPPAARRKTPPKP